MVGEKPSLRVLLRSAADEARDALSRAPERAIVASPFLTSPTAISIIRRADSRTAVVLTTFDVEAFLSRASSIRTVRRLLEMGYDVRAMDGLHAKIVLTERVALIGSQNLTVNGTRNFEATAVIEDKATLADIRAQLVGWLDKARTITMEMVADVERLLPPLRRRATDMEGSVSKAKLSLREAERVREQRREETERREREASARRRQEEEQRIAAALAFDALQEAVAAAESSLDAARLKLQHIDLPEQKSYWTLLADAGADLRVWRFGNWYGAQPALTRRFRYLLIAPHTGRLGWPALNKTRLTRFGTGLQRKEHFIRLGDEDFWPDITLNQDAATLRDWNVRFRLTSTGGASEGGVLTIDAIFSLTGLLIRRTETASIAPDAADELERGIFDEGSRVSTELRSAVLAPFRYKKNRAGVDAWTFCVGLPRWPTLRLRRYEGIEFFSLE